MFTGLIQQIGRLKSLTGRGKGASVTIECDTWPAPLVKGESVSVQGICLTVSSASDKRFSCDVLQETLARTNLGQAASGQRLNLERALKTGDRMGGHFVTGHVDGKGRVAEVRKSSSDWIIEIMCVPLLMAQIAAKGSIAVDGVSLTVACTKKNSFEVHVIPVTWSATTICELRRGSEVNLETDILAKYMERRSEIAGQGKRNDSITAELLRKSGFDV